MVNLGPHFDVPTRSVWVWEHLGLEDVFFTVPSERAESCERTQRLLFIRFHGRLYGLYMGLCLSHSICTWRARLTSQSFDLHLLRNSSSQGP